MNKTCAVIIAAYNCEKYINECVESVMNQIPREGWTYKIRVGIDGCEKTSRSCSVPHYYSSKNVGAYITRNSLIKIKPADIFSYFDADDFMMSDYLNRSLSEIDLGAHAVMCAKINCDEKLNPIRAGACIEYGGAITFDSYVLDSVGGFYGVRCAADSDFMARIAMAGFKIAEIKEPLYKRRRHKESLTRARDTGIGSDYRKKVWADMCAKREKGIIKIIPTVVPLEWREK